MDEDERELEYRFQQMETDELVSRLQSGNLTETAISIARTELERRGVNLDFTPTATSEASDPPRLTNISVLHARLSSWPVILLHAFGGFISGYCLLPLLIAFTGKPAELSARVSAFALFIVLVAVGIFASTKLVKHILEKSSNPNADLMKIYTGYVVLFVTLKGIDRFLGPS